MNATMAIDVSLQSLFSESVRAPGSDFDQDTSMALFNGTARQLYRALELSAHNWEKLRGRGKYKGSGTWYSYRNSLGQMCIVVDVGCWCEHDCCGHLCSLSYTLIPKEFGGFIVIVSRSFNY